MEKNVFCYFSEVGNNNFFYPTAERGFVKNNAEYEVLPWLCSNKKLQAIKLKNKYIVSLTPTKKHITLNKAKAEKYSVVWVEKTILPLSSVG